MKQLLWALALGVALFAAPAVAAPIVAKIDLSEQRMYVYVNGVERYEWPVSTARSGYLTPVGSYHPIRMHAMWYSHKYHNSPMPSSIFFRGGYAVHGTTDLRALGRPASHGCVRLHPDNARLLFELVNQYGMANADIVIIR